MALRINGNEFSRKVFLTFLALNVLTVILDIVINRLDLFGAQGVRQIFNIAREQSFGTWVSSVLLLLSGITLAMIGWVERQNSAKSKVAFGWWVLAAFFIYLSMDEASEFHERVGTAVRIFWNGSEEGRLGYFPSFSWQVVFGPVFAAMGLFILWFFKKHLSKKDFILILLALSCYVAAVFFDFVEGLQSSPYEVIALQFDVELKTVSHYSKVIEEFLEATGTAFFLFAFLKKLTGSKPALNLTFN